MDHSGDSTAADTATPPVDILIAGVPGPLMQWTFDLLARAVAGRYPGVVHLQIGGDGRWNPPDAGPDQAARLFVGDVLHEAWAAPVRAGRIVAVLVIDDVSLAWEQLRQMGQSAAEAARNLVAIATSFGDVAGHDRVLTVTRSAGDDQVALAARILTHVGLHVATSDQLFAMLAAGGPAQVLWDLPQPIPIAAESVPMIETVVLSAFEYGRGRTHVPVTWPRECLFWGDRPNEALPRVRDLTGPSRILAYGPYLPLPPGRWTMSTTWRSHRPAAVLCSRCGYSARPNWDESR